MTEATETDNGILGDIRSALGKIIDPTPPPLPQQQQVAPQQQQQITPEQYAYMQQMQQRQAQQQQMMARQRRLDDVDSWLDNSYRFENIERELSQSTAQVKRSITENPLLYGVGLVAIMACLYAFKKNKDEVQFY